MSVTNTLSYTVPFIVSYEDDGEINKKSIEKEKQEYTISEFNSFYKSGINQFFSNLKRIIPYIIDNEYETVSRIKHDEEVMNKYYVTKSKIEIFDEIYEFNLYFMYSIVKEEDIYIAENELFNIFGYGDTKEEAEKELYGYLHDLWIAYAEENDENLDESALELKHKLLNSIRKIN